MPDPEAPAQPGPVDPDSPGPAAALLPAAPTRPPLGLIGRLVGNGWFWALFVGTLVSFPLLKSLDKELPPMPPGEGRQPIDFTLPDETGRMVSLSDLGGHLKVITELPLAESRATQESFDGIRALRKRLRGLASTVVYVVLCHGGDRDTLSALLDERTARKPVNIFLMDEGRATAAWLRREAGSELAAFFLADRHGRIRRAYPGTQDGIDRLIYDAGLLANVPEADRPPED